MRFANYLLVTVALAVLPLASCSRKGGTDAEETVRKFVEYWLAADMDSVRAYCSDGVFESISGVFEENEGDSAVISKFRQMLSSTKIVSSELQPAGDDSVTVALVMEGPGGAGNAYRGNFLAVKNDGKWTVAGIL